jgi:hypothetical protein
MIRRIGIAGAVFCCALIALAQQAGTAAIDGDWNVTFSIEGQTVSGQMTFHADRDELSGTMETAHTGRGRLQGGAWSHDKLAGIYVFEHHEAIALAGELRDGRLAGTFRTEGMDGKWEALRASAPR